MAQLNVEVIVGLVNRLTGPLGRLRADINRTMNIAANMTFVGGAMQRTGAALMRPLADATRSAMTFESAMADVKKVVDFGSPQGARAFADLIGRMSREIPLTAEGLAQIAAAGGQLGIAAPDLPSYVETVAKMATAFDMAPDAAGEAMAKLANVYQIPIPALGSLGDAINHLSNNTAAKASDIIQTLGRVGGTARQFGLSAIEAGALADAFIALGKPPEVAATAINAMLLKLQTASKQNKKFQGALTDMGVSASALEQAIGRDAQGALLGFLETLSKVDGQARAGLLSDLFGLEYSDDISLLAGSLDQYRKALGLIGSEGQYAGSMQAEFAARADTTANGLVLLTNRVDELKRTIGDALNPVIDNLSGKLAGVVSGLTDWLKAHPRLASGAAIVAGALGAFASALGGIVSALGGAVGSLLMFSMMFGGFGKAIGFALAPLRALAGVFPALLRGLGLLRLALVANPIGALIAVVSAAAYVFTHWEETVAAASRAWEWLIEKLGFDPVAAVSASFQALGAYLGTLAGQMMSEGTKIGAAIVAGIKSGLSQAWEGVKALASKLADSLPQWVREKLGIASPSKVFATIGEQSMRGLQMGLQAARDLPLESLGKLASGMALTASLIAAPVAAASARLPEVVLPEVALPEVVLPEVALPEVVRPEVGRPGVVRPDAAALAAPRGASGAASISMPITINITAPPGADTRELAELVRREVAQATRQGTARIAALYDRGDGL